MMKNWIQGILLLIVAAAVAYILWSGLVNPVKVQRERWNPVPVVYAIHNGPYSQTGKVMDQVYNFLLEHGVKATMGAGVFFDDPSKVPAEGLRSAAGCVVDETFDENILKGTPYRLKVIPEAEYVASSFPYRGALSIYLGVMRVYPRMARFAAENSIPAGPALEIYDMPNERTRYLMPVEASTLSWETFQEPSHGI